MVLESDENRLLSEIVLTLIAKLSHDYCMSLEQRGAEVNGEGRRGERERQREGEKEEGEIEGGKNLVASQKYNVNMQSCYFVLCSVNSLYS